MLLAFAASATDLQRLIVQLHSRSTKLLTEARTFNPLGKCLTEIQAHYISWQEMNRLHTADVNVVVILPVGQRSQ